jgi:UDP-3-O-[3-hydroxymyristoyl] glucosamine N-acyltransferase
MQREFFQQPSRLTIGEIAALTGAEPLNGAPLDRVISDAAPLDLAGPSDLTFIDSARYLDSLATTRAAACLIAEQFVPKAPPGLILLRTREPYRAFVAVQRKLFPDSVRPTSLFGAEGVAPGAVIHSSARLEPGAIVDPGAVIGPGAHIGSGTVIGPTAVIGPGVHIGRDCAIGAGCSITHALIGDRVIIHPGCRIGQDGFGYLSGKSGAEKVPQVGRVIIQDDVEIGANTTIDRGSMRDTFIGEGTKIDNLVQIGHNCRVGRHCIIVAQTGLSGSVTLEDYVVLGARVGIVEHMTVGKGAQIAARSSVVTNVPPNARYAGLFKAKPINIVAREIVTLERLARRHGAPESAESGQ